MINVLSPAKSASHRHKREPVAGNTPETRPTNNAYFPALDGIRGVAFLMVFATHYLLLSWGFTGVDLFFVLSGFLITGILYDTRDAPNRAWNFYIRRTLRIFPLYYGLMILLVLLYPVFRWDWRWTWVLWPLYLGNFGRFVHPAHVGDALQMMADFQPHSLTFPKVQLYLGHFWSLCVEEQFYLIWPWVVFWVKDRKKLIWICALSIPVCTAARIFAYHHVPAFMNEREITQRLTPFRLDTLLIGGLLALVRRGPKPKMLLPWARFFLVALPIAFLWWHVTHKSVWGSYWNFWYPEWKTTWAITGFEIFYASLILLALEYGSLTFRIFNVEPLKWIGRISYGAYVFHDILHNEISPIGYRISHAHARWATAGLALTLTFVVAWASFRWFESPFIRMKEKLTRT